MARQGYEVSQMDARQPTYWDKPQGYPTNKAIHTIVFKKASSAVSQPGNAEAALQTPESTAQSAPSPTADRRAALAKRKKQLNALYKGQRSGISGRDRFLAPKMTGLAGALADDEEADRVFYARIDDKMATVALTDRRLLVAYGMLEHTVGIDYSAISRVQAHEGTLEVTGVVVREGSGGVSGPLGDALGMFGGKGSGYDLKMTGVAQVDEVANELERRRANPLVRPTRPVRSDADEEDSTSAPALSESTQAVGGLAD